jgi:hypothetical protein
MAVSLVQEKSNSVAANPSSVTVTLSSATTLNNTLIVLIGSYNSTTVPSPISGVTLGGSAGSFASQYFNSTGPAGTYSDYCGWALWMDPKCAGGQTSVVTSLTTPADTYLANVFVYEVAGLNGGVLDQVSYAGSSTTTFSSGSTPTTTAANEFWCGGVISDVSGPSYVLPSSPWVNDTTLESTYYVAAGYQVATSTGSAVYSGTRTGSGYNGPAVVFTFKPSTSNPGAFFALF